MMGCRFELERSGSMGAMLRPDEARNHLIRETCQKWIEC